MMTSDCPKAIISFSYSRWPSAYHFFLVEIGELECLPEMYLICCWRLIEHYTAQAHYSHDIALVDQGGTRPTF